MAIEIRKKPLPPTHPGPRKVIREEKYNVAEGSLADAVDYFKEKGIALDKPWVEQVENLDYEMEAHFVYREEETEEEWLARLEKYKKDREEFCRKEQEWREWYKKNEKEIGRALTEQRKQSQAKNWTIEKENLEKKKAEIEARLAAIEAKEKQEK